MVGLGTTCHNSYGHAHRGAAVATHSNRKVLAIVAANGWQYSIAAPRCALSDLLQSIQHEQSLGEGKGFSSSWLFLLAQKTML
jgi:hypothetical protein